MERFRIFICLALACGLGIHSIATAAESLAPPHNPTVRGHAVPVAVHPGQETLLTHADPVLAANKRLVHEFWRTVVLGGQVARTGEFIASNFVEHNPLVPTGRAAFQRYLAAHSKAADTPETIPDLVTLIAEGPYVVMALVTHYPEPGDRNKTYTTTRFEMFRLVDGLIAEHWDSTPFRVRQSVPNYRGDNALPVTGISGKEQEELLVGRDQQLSLNKRLVFDLWRHVVDAGQEDMVGTYLDTSFIGHNPRTEMGRESFEEYFARRPDQEVQPYLAAPLVAMVAEGDLVVQVLQTTRNRGVTVYQVPSFEMFRIRNGRIAEHWNAETKGELPASTPRGALGL